MTHNTREVEEIVEEFNRKYYNQEFSYPDGEFTFTFVTDHLRTVLHHQLQKAREEMLNELEYRLGDRPFQIGSEPKWDRGVMFQWQGVKNWIAEKRKAYHSELDQDVSK